MLAANEAVANYLLKHNLPYLARAHDEPEETSIAEFRDMARALGHNLPSPGTRQQIQKFLVRVAGKPTAGILKDVVNVQPHTQVEVHLLANHPGPALFHCHMQIHMDYGFMTLLEYLDAPGGAGMRHSHG